MQIISCFFKRRLLKFKYSSPVSAAFSVVSVCPCSPSSSFPSLVPLLTLTKFSLKNFCRVCCALNTKGEIRVQNRITRIIFYSFV